MPTTSAGIVDCIRVATPDLDDAVALVVLAARKVDGCILLRHQCSRSSTRISPRARAHTHIFILKHSSRQRENHHSLADRHRTMPCRQENEAFESERTVVACLHTNTTNSDDWLCQLK